jgi:ketosteroid isomerase-like protein
MNNLPTVQSIYEAFRKGDVPAILDVLVDDVEWEARADNSAVKADVPTMIPRHGKTEVAKVLRDGESDGDHRSADHQHDGGRKRGSR